MSAGDIDGDGRVDPILAALIPHTPYRACGSRVSNGFVFLMSAADLPAADAPDGAADGEIHLDALRVEVDPEPLVVHEVTQFEDSVVVMRVSGSLKTTELDFDLLSRSFYSHYEDELDYLIFISNLPTLQFNFEHHSYYGIHAFVGQLRDSDDGTVPLGFQQRQRAAWRIRLGESRGPRERPLFGGSFRDLRELRQFAAVQPHGSSISQD